MTPLDNLRRLAAGWRGEWRVDAHEGITLSHDGDEWPIGALDGDAVIMLVELLNAIRPAVDGATAEIERLTGELAAEQDKRSDAIRERNEAEERARSAEAGNRVLQAEVVRMDAELAAARAVPADVEAAIKSTVDGAEEAGRCSALGHAYLITKAPFWTVPHLKAAIARAIADATASKSATVGIAAAIKSVERIESTSKALGYSADYMAAIDRVLSCLRAVAENGGPLASTVDGGAGKPATVGGLLANEADALLCRWYAAKQDAIGALVDLENLRRPDPDDSWAGGIGRHDPMPGAEKRAADTKERLVAITDKVIAAMTRGPIGEG